VKESADGLFVVDDPFKRTALRGTSPRQNAFVRVVATRSFAGAAGQLRAPRSLTWLSRANVEGRLLSRNGARAAAKL